MITEDAKFVVNDLVTITGSELGRVVQTQFATASTLKLMGEARLAGFTPEWFYRVEGKGFDSKQWYRQSTIQFAAIQ